MSAAQLTNDPSGHGLKLPVLDARRMILCDAITAGENVSIVGGRRTIPYKLGSWVDELKSTGNQSDHQGS